MLDRPWQELSVDFVTDLPDSNGNTFVMVVTDRLSKNMVFEAMDITSATAVVEKLLKGVFRYYGLPRAIVSDRGP